MFKSIAIVPFIVFLASPALFPVSADDADSGNWATGFAAPPDSAAPHTWWHWMDGNVSRDGITADLEAMQRIGIRSATIVWVGVGVPSGPVKYLTPQWLGLVKFAAQEAHRLNIKLGMGNCAGWSSSGGAWVTPEYSMQMVVSSERKVTGPSHFSAALPQPETRLGFYRDLEVVAFPTLAGEDPAQGPAPTVTSSDPNFDAARFSQGKGAALPAPTQGRPQYIQFEFAQPLEVRTVSMAVRSKQAGGVIEASDDGQAFRELRPFNLNNVETQVDEVAPVSARFYRVVFRQVKGEHASFHVQSIQFSSALRIDRLAAKADYGRRADAADSAAPQDLTAPADMVVHPDQTIDLTSHMDKNGKLDWDVPAGNWTVLRFGYTTTAEPNHPVTPDSKGLECDKLSKAAARFYWNGVMPKVAAALGPLMGTTFDHALIDSYEVGNQNWTPAFREEFRKRCGYDMFPFLPVLTGRVVESPGKTERFLWDYRKTIADLFSENYYDYFDVMAHESGMKLEVEPYGDGPFDFIRAGRDADRVMGEFWWPGGNSSSLHIGASVAHVYGKKISGAESFTSTHGGWDMSPPTMKALGDMAFTAGINSYDFHRYAHQPWMNRFPGMTMGPWGSTLERTNNWWDEGGAWMKYLTRCEYLLQKGLFVADVLCFEGEDEPTGSSGIPVASGYASDDCDLGVILNRLSVKNGRLVLPDGMSYRFLVLKPAEKMTPVLLRKLKALADAGATIVGGPKPTGSPSLVDYPQCDQEVKKLADELWDGGKIVSGKSADEELAGLGLMPDFHADTPVQPLYIHRVSGDTEFYFVSNQENSSVDADCVFRVTGKVPELWHADTGEIEKVAAYREEKGDTRIPLHLDPVGSVFVVFRGEKVPADQPVSLAQAAGSMAPPAPSSLVINHATWGDLENGDGTADVTAKLNALVQDGTLNAAVDNGTFGGDPAPNIRKSLKLDYTLDGRETTETLDEGDRIDLASDTRPLQPVLLRGKDGALNLEAWTPGSYEIKMSSGPAAMENVADFPGRQEVAGSWDVEFPPNWGAPPQVTLDKLISWPDSPISGVKYFSGTATYLKTLSVPAEMLGAGHRLYLDLGDVQVIAQVKLNGQDLGILWKPPYRVEITDCAKAGDNTLQVKVTNLWPNRRIGDDQLPEDCEWNPNGALKEWPQWFLDGKPSPTGRFTFATWKHYNKDSPLFPSGLIGPVALVPAVQVAVH